MKGGITEISKLKNGQWRIRISLAALLALQRKASRKKPGNKK
jgi:hypothetical protein